MKNYYSQANIIHLQTEYNKFFHNMSPVSDIGDLLQQIVPRADITTEEYKFAYYGIGRRLGILRQCVINIFTIRPVEKVELPTDTELTNLTINLHSFYFNLYGVLENLARLYALKIGFDSKYPRELSFFDDNKKLLKTLPDDIRKQYNKHRKWLKYLRDMRHPLAHQEPFYIPAFVVDIQCRQEFEKLNLAERAAWEACIDGLKKVADDVRQRRAQGVVDINMGIKDATEVNALIVAKDKKVAEIKQQQKKYEIFVPAIVLEDETGVKLTAQFYPQVLVDMKTVYEQVLVILRYLNQRQGV